MARGNQRDKAREKNLKEQAGKVCSLNWAPDVCARLFLHSSKCEETSNNVILTELPI